MGVAVGVHVGVQVCVAVGVQVCVAVGVAVSVAVGVQVGVAVGVAVSVAVGVQVGVAGSVAVGVGVSVAYTDAENIRPQTITAKITKRRISDPAKRNKKKRQDNKFKFKRRLYACQDKALKNRIVFCGLNRRRLIWQAFAPGRRRGIQGGTLTP